MLQGILIRLISAALLLALGPLFLILFICVKLSSKGPFIFKQKRLGKDKKPFIMYKIRTMVENAEELKQKYKKLNEADGPVFKIRNDPRYTKVGKLIAQTGFDELPQLINIIKGEMLFVGPRPLPVEEALKVPKKYESRFYVLPGITSLWAVKGSHKLTFDQWMKLDLEYIKNHSLYLDIKIMLLTIIMISRSLLKLS